MSCKALAFFSPVVGVMVAYGYISMNELCFKARMAVGFDWMKVSLATYYADGVLYKLGPLGDICKTSSSYFALTISIGSGGAV